MPTTGTKRGWKSALIASACTLTLSACSGAGGGFNSAASGDFQLETVASQNASERVRFLVMHYTAEDFASSLRILTQPSPYPVSAHYLVPESGDPSYPHSDLRVYQLVDESRRAWHAGPGEWEDRTQVNDQSIGIEIVNQGRCHPPVEMVAQKAGEEVCFFPEFDDRQIELLIALSHSILERYPEITPTRVVGHSDIRPYQKVDPGPRFPWEQLAAAGIGAWYDDDTAERHLENLRGNTSSDRDSIRRRFARWLSDYGYGIDPETASDEDIGLYTRAFQYHFRPWKVDGEVDNQTRAILLALLEKYFPDKLSGYSEINTGVLAELQPDE